MEDADGISEATQLCRVEIRVGILGCASFKVMRTALSGIRNLIRSVPRTRREKKKQLTFLHDSTRECTYDIFWVPSLPIGRRRKTKMSQWGT